MGGKKQGPSCPLCGAPYSQQRNHYGLRDIARFYPLNSATHIVWDDCQHSWACEECGESWGGEYDDPCCPPHGWNFCSNCGKEVCNEQD